MKKSLSVFFGLFLIFSTFNAFAGIPRIVNLKVKHVYVPYGFDGNDNVEIILQGDLPNLCHRFPSTKMEKNGNDIHINLQALYYEESNPYCPPITVPFLESVRLGVLAGGTYNIIVNGGTNFEHSTQIIIEKESSGEVDDYIYANVEYIGHTRQLNTIKLAGVNPTDCLELDQVKFVSNKKDTFAILPIMKKVKTHCPQTPVPFEYIVDIPKELTKKEILLHVRVMNGKSLNVLHSNL